MVLHRAVLPDVQGPRHQDGPILFCPSLPAHGWTGVQVSLQPIAQAFFLQKLKKPQGEKTL